MNNPRLNRSKTLEMVVSRKGKWGSSIPPILPEAEGVESLRILGIVFRQDLQN